MCNIKMCDIETCNVETRDVKVSNVETCDVETHDTKLRNIKLTLSYDGTDFYGWQYQPDQPTVQGTIKSALERMLSEQVSLIGAGRTDAKAHAIRYTANFRTSNRSVPAEKFVPALNSLLPPSIRLLDSETADPEFHSQYSAKAREYVYLIDRSPAQLPFLRNYSDHYSAPVDEKRLIEACRFFRGRHDFHDYCYGYGSAEMPETVRTVFYLRSKVSVNRIVFFIKAEGFLRGMIRTIISVCLRYQEGELNAERIHSSLSGEDSIPSKLKPAVPARGLYFKRAYY